MEQNGRLYKIGELAELSGVSTKTIRYYSDVGVLPPTSLSESGYRLYSEADRARLALVRALREIGFDLRTVLELLQQQVSVKQALALQLEAVELELRNSRRQRALLKAALQKDDAQALSYLDRARALTKLTALERREFLERHLERVFEGVPADETWKAAFWQGVVLELPEEMTEAQVDAWLELAELVSDESFLQRVNEIGRDYWESAAHRPGAGESSHSIQDLYAEAIEAMQAGHAPESSHGQEVVAGYMRAVAEPMGWPQDGELPGRLLDVFERNAEPRAERYWELIAILKDWQPPPIAAAHRWLVEGLRWRRRVEIGD